jgi:hypothetical protein
MQVYRGFESHPLRMWDEKRRFEEASPLGGNPTLSARLFIDILSETTYTEDMAKHPQQQQQKKQTTPTQKAAAETEQVEEELNYPTVETYLEWEAPGRPFKKRSREYFINALLITIAVEIILFLFSQYFLMMVVFALIFLSFALASVPPRTFSYKVSSEGILIENNFFIWEELYDFYFTKYHDEDVLHVETKSFFPGELTITLGDVPAEAIKATLLPYLPFREYVEPSFLEKAGHWLEKNFPLERSLR